MDDQAKSEKIAKLVNLMMASESEGEVIQCWRSARALAPDGKLMDHIPTKGSIGSIPLFDGDLNGFSSWFADFDRQEREATNEKSRANRAKRAELNLRERELKLKEREEAILRAQREREAQADVPRAVREQADLMAGIERLSKLNPGWTDRRIARELKISPSTVGKYRSRAKGCR